MWVCEIIYILSIHFAKEIICMDFSKIPFMGVKSTLINSRFKYFEIVVLLVKSTLLMGL